MTTPPSVPSPVPAGTEPGALLAAVSAWIDVGQGDRDPEAILWGRVSKITEEAGEAIAALIGATGQNPRKGVTHTMEDVQGELLDVALTALAAVEHLNENDGSSLGMLTDKIVAVARRAGVLAAVVSSSPATPRGHDEQWQPEDHVTLFIDDLTALLNDCAQGGDVEPDGRPAYVAVWAVRGLLQKAFAREIEWAATSDEIVQALRENGEPL